MICSFYDQGTEDIFNGKDSKQARRICPQSIWPIARRKLNQVNAAVSRRSLRLPRGNEWEMLTKDRKGQDSIRINDQYRVCYIWKDTGPERVEICDYH